ncbi:stage II sporulation protein P [Paenibacillus pini]|uniref:Stage II sporulation protein P n=1 Tax=Paenibacillus pini JCM 16418 TaxID=1236976 RepID=W7YEQ6_9BACL|nr:stage II sporulation protein P [Paenibacillus pini]GAF06997.1 stage II sporulation protein P [Paenibacillus pini JCM 16418]
MKRNGFQLWNIAKFRAKLLHILTLGRTFVLLMVSSLLFFVVLGLGGIAEQRLNSSPVSSMKGFAGSLSSQFFMDMLGMELPNLAKADKDKSTFSGENMTTFMFQMLTSVNIRDPKSLVAREMPGLGSNDPVLLRIGSGNKNLEGPEDFHPPGDTALATDDTDPTTGSNGKTDATEREPQPGGKKNPTGTTPIPDTEDKVPSTGSLNKQVLIYHSHPRESYNPLLGKTSNNPSSSSSSKNVMVVGSYMAQRLEKLGVGTVHAQKDYVSTVAGYNYNFSYKYSRQTVKQAMSQNSNLTYLLDIHRDSQRHGKSTAVVNGASYAQVFFIIGHENKKWRENEAFANAIHERLEKQYPGISRGIWGKTSAQGNGEYNQTLSTKSILIEVGGIDSTNEELRRTAEILGDIVADLYYQDQKTQKANVVVPEPGKKTEPKN